jgi:hypothetical protein
MPTFHDRKRQSLRQRLAAEISMDFKITTEEIAVLNRQIDREIAVSRATRERRRAFVAKLKMDLS